MGALDDVGVEKATAAGAAAPSLAFRRAVDTDRAAAAILRVLSFYRESPPAPRLKCEGARSFFAVAQSLIRLIPPYCFGAGGGGLALSPLDGLGLAQLPGASTSAASPTALTFIDFAIIMAPPACNLAITGRVEGGLLQDADFTLSRWHVKGSRGCKRF
jgi:hypothetical protein